MAEYASSTDKIVDGLETLLRRKDEAITKLEVEVKDSKKLQVSQRKDDDERDDLKRQRDTLQEELRSATERMRMKATQDMVEIKSNAENEKIKLQLNMDTSLKTKDELIKNLETEIKTYELERNSLRKLTELGFERFVFLFNQAY